jgi:hypothetical protein
VTDLVLSASQAETFDPEQLGGCPRRWWFERVDGQERPSSASAEDGIAGHALLASWMRTGVLPSRFKLLKAVKGALHRLPARSPGQLVESRFDSQPHDPDGLRRPLDRKRTLWLGGVPWDGYVDLRWRDGDMVTVWDHKFSSDIDTYAKPADQLIRTIQMPVYALDSLRIWPDAKRFRLVHLYISRRGVHSFIREQTVTRDEIARRTGEIAALVARIQETAQATRQDDVPANRRACHAYNGCPHQSVCTAFRRKPMYELSEEEKALFGMVSEVTGEKPKAIDASDAALDALSPAERAATLDQTSDARAALTDVSIPLPQASAPTPQCSDCGAKLTKENGSERDGKWSHIGCPTRVERLAASDAATLAAERAKPDTVGMLGALAQCQDCPHPAHPGVQCAGKRGRGQCRCGAANAAPAEAEAIRLTQTRTAAESIARGDIPAVMVDGVVRPDGSGSIAMTAFHLPTCVQSDGGKWLCMEGCSAGGTVVGGGELAAAAYQRANGGGAHRAEAASAPGPADYQVLYMRADAAEVEAKRLRVRLAEYVDAGRPALAHPLSGTLRVEIGLDWGTSQLVERLIDALKR